MKIAALIVFISARRIGPEQSFKRKVIRAQTRLGILGMKSKYKLQDIHTYKTFSTVKGLPTVDWFQLEWSETITHCPLIFLRRSV